MMMLSGCGTELSAHFYSAASLKYRKDPKFSDENV